MSLNFLEMEKEYSIKCEELNVNENSEEYFIQNTKDIEDIKNSHKKCGEIYMTGTENFKFVCMLCEKTFFTFIEEFLIHVAHCQQSDEICALEFDPLEADQDYDVKRPYVNKQSVILKKELTESFDFNTDDFMPTDSIEKDVSNFVLPNHENIDKMVAKNKVNINSIQLFSCNYCEKKYSWRDSLRRHLKRSHPYHIPGEEISTFTKMNKTSENDTNYKKDYFSCDHCDRKFLERDSLNNHLKDEHFLNFNISGEHSKTGESINRITEENSKVFIYCDISDCNKKFKKKESIDIHKKFEHKQDPEGLMVEENDYSKDETNEHNSEETKCEIDRYTCRYCERRFSAPYKRVQHERIHTGEKPFKCSVCGKGFRAIRYKTIHERTHQNIRPHKCDICDAAFLEKSNLTQHIQRHFGNKKYQCTFCEKKFHSSTEKVFHERTHTGEKSYLCFECGKSFSVPSKLNTHLKRHTGVKPFKCDQCDKTFFSKQLLKDHYVVHTREKPFTCHICDAKFPRRKSLLSHMKIHSDVAQYSCTICGKSFKQGPGLYSHMKSHGKVLTKP